MQRWLPSLPVDWVDLLIVGLMLLAAVHGLQLGALVQLFTFGGFFLGFLIGTFVWIPLLSTGHDDVTRSIVVVSLIMLTACLFGYGGRVLGAWSNVTMRRHHLGHVDAAMGVGVAVLAVLRTSAPLGPVLRVSSNLVSRGTQAALLGYPENGSLSIGPAGVNQEVTALGKDIYNNASVTRGVYELNADVLPGNSGGPLMGPGGQVVGVVFSRSTVYSNVGYALTSPGVLSRVQQAALQRSPVGTGPCISG